MKKALLSIAVIASFALYAVTKKGQPTVASSLSPNIGGTTVAAGYRDGQYTGMSADAYYGRVQVQVIVSGGRIADVQFLDWPRDRHTSELIAQDAMPLLKSEAIAAQRGPVNIVSGATETSGAFNQSLVSALAQAQGA